jgi:hypothetical protein
MNKFNKHNILLAQAVLLHTSCALIVSEIMFVNTKFWLGNNVLFQIEALSTFVLFLLYGVITALFEKEANLKGSNSVLLFNKEKITLGGKDSLQLVFNKARYFYCLLFTPAFSVCRQYSNSNGGFI